MATYTPKPNKYERHLAHIWNHWNGYYTQTASTSISNHQLAIWTYWNQNTLVTGTTNNVYQADIWAAWNQSNVVHQSQLNVRYPAYVAPAPPTPEQLAAREAENERYRVEREARRLRVVAAEDRAKLLLLDHLDDQQKRDYEEKHHFDVEVDGKTYRVLPGTHGNVQELVMHEGRETTTRRFCIPSRIHDMPEADVHLAQKLMIEGAMDQFEQIANISVYRADLLRV